MRYFSGHTLGTVSALPQQNFTDLCYEVFEKPIRLKLTREAYHALPKKSKDAPLDQQRAKQVRYITPCTFKASPSNRNYESAEKCNLIALDIDGSLDTKRLLTQNWDNLLGEYGYCVWHTATSTPGHPRLRVMVNAEGIAREQYCAALRTIAELIGLTEVTKESKVIVQPMYLPTIFSGEQESPIVAIQPQGEPFRAIDIIADEESSLVASPRSEDVKDIADLEFLRAPLDGITIGDAKEALAHLDPDMPMQQWIEVAAGLKHQFDSEEAYQAWDMWSSKGKKYADKEETRYRWNSLKAQSVDRAPVTIRSVFKFAQARGWSNQGLARRFQQEATTWLASASRSTEELLDQGPKRIAKIASVVTSLERKVLMVTLRDALANRHMPVPLPDIRKAVRELELEAARTSGTPQWCKGLCYVTAINSFYRHAVDRKFSPEVLDLMYSTPSIGEERQVRPRDFAVQIAGIPQVENLKYDPAQGTKRYYSENGVPFVNTYRAEYATPDPDRAEEAGEIFVGHLTKLIKETEHRVMLLDWLAYLIQHPGKKIRWAPLIQGGEGCGKTVLAVAMSVCLGRRNVAKVNGLDVMEGKFNTWAYGRQLVALEEVRIVGANRHAVMDRLKPLITDDEIAYHKKHEDLRTVANITNYLLFTNYHDALAINEDGRRYFCLSSPLQSAEDISAVGGKEHFNQVYGMLRDNPGGLRAWFEGWQISPTFNPEGRAPITEYLHELAENSCSPLTQAVRHCIEDEPHPLLRKDLLSLNCLRGCLESASLPPFSDQALTAVLRELGWIKYDRCVIAGGKHQLWTKGRLKRVRQVAELRASLF